MNAKLKKILMGTTVAALATVAELAITFSNISPRIGAADEGHPATLKLTWDFSTNTTTNTTAFSTATLKTFIEAFDSPSYSYTVSATNNTYRGSGSTGDTLPDDNWKFSSGNVNGSATITGLPTYGYVKIWAYLWSTDVATMKVNDGTAQSVVGNAYNLYEFDVTDTTTFKIDAVKRFLIQKIEFWGC